MTPLHSKQDELWGHLAGLHPEISWEYVIDMFPLNTDLEILLPAEQRIGECPGVTNETVVQ